MRDLLQDLKLAVRTLAKQRGFTVAVLLTLAIGLGGNIAIFSVVNGVLLQPLPYPEADRIVRLRELHDGHESGISTLTYLDWKNQNEVFDFFAADANHPVILSGVAEPLQVRSNAVTADFFQVFGIRAALGRTFQPGDDEPGKPLVAVISDSFWRSQFGAAPDILGRSVLLDDQPHTIVGVLPGGTAIDRSYHQLWRPLVFTAQNRTRNYHWLGAVARLKPGVSLERAQANMNVIAERIALEHPETNRAWGARVRLFKDGVVGRELRQSLRLLMAAAAVVLVIACVNVANLCLTRGLARQREISIRLSLGASRARLIRQYATEGALLCAVGCGLGLALAYGSVAATVAVLPLNALPAEAEIGLDVPVLIFALALMTAATLFCAVLPAAQATRAAVAPDLQRSASRASAGKTQTRLHGVFVVVQVALAFALLTSVGLLIRSIQKLSRVDIGVDTAALLTARLPIATQRFETADAFLAYLRSIVGRVRELPGVSDAAFTATIPLQGGGYGTGLQIVGDPVADPANRPFTFLKPVGASYFQTAGLPRLRGRLLSSQDTSRSAPVAVVNQAFARRFFASRDPIGQRVLIPGVLFGKLGRGADIPWEIVGVIGDEQVQPLHVTEPEPVVYVSLEQSPQMISQLLVIRAAGDPATLANSVRTALRQLHPDQPVTELQTLDDVKARFLGPRRFQSGLLALFAAVAVLLAALGLYGVLAQGVQQRTRELGIRSALGASARKLIAHVLARGLKLVALGLTAGLLITLGVSRLLASFVFGIGERDPLSLAAGFVLLATVAGAACYLPARRAAKIDPAICLRSE